ncbi:MAG: hypothetical protein JXK07_12080 [Spirochaetes bacterium]|nr:hypothetical protein [Spirochaetota bacterium]MBN2769438.1 hypothetical protein [Spirochaetota bacterium]
MFYIKKNIILKTYGAAKYMNQAAYITAILITVICILATVGCKDDTDKHDTDNNTSDKVTLLSDSPIQTVNEPADAYSSLAAAYGLTETDQTNFHLFGMISDPSVVYDNERYRMWFSAVKNIDLDGQVPPDKGDYNADEDQLNIQGIAYAESSDGLHWSDPKNMTTNVDLVLEPEEGAWDKYGMETCTVVKQPDTDIWYLYYAGKTSVEYNGVTYRYFSGIGCATSSDGNTWTKRESPVITSEYQWEKPYYTSTWYQDLYTANNGDLHEAGGLMEPTVIYDTNDKIFKMWYGAMGESTERDGTTWDVRMCYAESEDGISWRKHPDYIFQRGTSGEWDHAWASHYNVIQGPNEEYHLFYAGQNSEETVYAIGHASSKDGLSWKRTPGNPILENTSGSWYEKMVGGPSAVLIDDTFHLWFFGSKLDNFSFVYFGYGTTEAGLTNME